MTALPSKARAHTGGGTGRIMKLRDWLSLAAIVGSLVLIFVITRFGQPERVKPGSPEYDAYIEHYIAECLRNPQPIEKGVASRPPKPSARLPAGSRCCKPIDSIPTTVRSSISRLARNPFSSEGTAMRLTNA